MDWVLITYLRHPHRDAVPTTFSGLNHDILQYDNRCYRSCNNSNFTSGRQFVLTLSWRHQMHRNIIAWLGVNFFGNRIEISAEIALGTSAGSISVVLLQQSHFPASVCISLYSSCPLFSISVAAIIMKWYFEHWLPAAPFKWSSTAVF